MKDDHRKQIKDENGKDKRSKFRTVILTLSLIATGKMVKIVLPEGGELLGSYKVVAAATLKSANMIFIEQKGQIAE